MNKKRTFIIVSIAFVIVIATIFISYGFITSIVSGNETSKKTVFNGQMIKVEYSDGTETLSSNQGTFTPGSTITKTFTIKNTGTESVKYSINLDNITNNFERKNDITYELISNDIILKNGIYEAKGVFPDNKLTILNNDALNKGESKTYTLKIIYLNSDENQIVDSGKSFSANILIDESKNNIDSLLVYGNSIQNGSPNPGNPVKIESLGNKTVNILDTENALVYHNNPYASTYEWERTKTGFKAKFLKSFSTGTSNRYGFRIGTSEELAGKTITVSYGEYIGTTETPIIALVTTNKEGEPSLKYEDVTSYSLGYIGSAGSATTLVNNSQTDSRNVLTYTIPETLENKYVAVLFYLNYNAPKTEIGDTIEYKNIQVEISDVVTEYEPYGKYKVPVKVSGKNLISDFIEGVGLNSTTGIEFETNYYASTDYIPVDFNINSTYYLSGLLDTLYSCVYAYNEDKVFLGRISGGSLRKEVSLKKHNFTLGTSQGEGDIAYLRVSQYYVPNSSTTGNVEDIKYARIQLEKGSTVTEFEPYVEPKTYNIYLDEPLRKIGDISDYIDFEEQKVFRNVKQHIFDGTEVVSEQSSSYPSDDTYLFAINLSSRINRAVAGGDWNSNKELCNYFTNANKSLQVSTNNNYEGFIGHPSVNYVGYFYFRLYKSRFTGETTNSAAFDKMITDWYQGGNPMILEYVTSSPADDKIELPTILTHNGTNIIEVCSSNGVCASNIEVEYDE